MFQAGLVGRLNIDSNSYVISGCHVCVAEARNTFVFSAESVTKLIHCYSDKHVHLQCDIIFRI